MIIDFTVKNFRSIKEEQVFSLYADKKLKHHAGNIAYPDEKIGVLKTASVYGANASGKSNLILALEILRDMVVDSGDLKEGDRIHEYDPYLLSKETINAPSRFEIEFFVKSNRYLYQIEFDEKNILFEKLDRFKTAKASNIFTRTSPDDWKAVKFGDSYKGGKRQFSFFSNNAYISKAGNSPESPDFIRDVYNFFRKEIMTLMPNQSVGVFKWESHPGHKKVMNAFLSRADFGIDSFEHKKVEVPDGLEFPDDMPEALKEKFSKEFSKKPIFYHKSDFGELVPFELHRESRGTTRIFRLVPFFTMVLEEGAILLVDEIEASLHPHLSELMIKLFNDPVVNTNNAQLIFTTHDISLMSQSMLRKDQIYLSSKTPGQGTEYVCLEDFDNTLKDSSPFAKWYMEGRLGNIPEINYRDISDAIRESIQNA